MRRCPRSGCVCTAVGRGQSRKIDLVDVGVDPLEGEVERFIVCCCPVSTPNERSDECSHRRVKMVHATFGTTLARFQTKHA
jgi:hypothetical protein